MYTNRCNINFTSIFLRRPDASADVRGSKKYTDINGRVNFYQTRMGVIVSAEISGLPQNQDKCEQPVFGFHIHSGTQCEGNADDPFAGAQGHYNPDECMHPYHAGDLPPLFGADGCAFSAFLTDRFSVKDIIGKTVIVHASPDDFMTQPSGNSGLKIACGEIRA